MSYPCVVCSRPVRPLQQALEYDSCENWQHRVCGSGMLLLYFLYPITRYCIPVSIHVYALKMLYKELKNL
jgi:DNA-directed RNA polymerase subunit RPC12/RpoP